MQLLMLRSVALSMQLKKRRLKLWHKILKSAISTLLLSTRRRRSIAASRRVVSSISKILPRRITGTSLKYQRRVAQAIKRARQIALLPYVTDMMK